MSDKLKPCPFCGGEAIVDGCDDTLWSVICEKCNASIDYNETKHDAIIAWNSRIRPTFTPDELDAIRRNVCDWRAERELSKIEQSIIDKCAKALKGARNDTGNI